MTARAKVKKRHPQAWCYKDTAWPGVYIVFKKHSTISKAIGVGLTEREAWESAERSGK